MVSIQLIILPVVVCGGVVIGSIDDDEHNGHIGHTGHVGHVDVVVVDNVTSLIVVSIVKISPSNLVISASSINTIK